MLFGFSLNLGDLCVGIEPETIGVEREKLEMIMVRSVPLRRARAAVTALAEVVHDLRSGPLSCPQRTRRWGDVDDSPMAESATGRVGVIDDQRKALRSGGRLAP